jgi:hypothetical protein
VAVEIGGRDGAMACGGGAAATAPGDILAPAVAATPYVELGF